MLKYRYYSENEEIEKRKKLLRELKTGGGAAGIVGGIGYGLNKGALALDKYTKKKILEGAEDYVKNPKILTPEQIEYLERGAKISKYIALTGGGVYVGTKAYEHFKDKKK